MADHRALFMQSEVDLEMSWRPRPINSAIRTRGTVMETNTESINVYSQQSFDQKVVKLSIEHPAILTIRELEVLRLIADGCTTKSIAQLLQITFKTARAYRFSIRKKLAVDSTVLAVRWAIRKGVIEP